MWHLLPAYILHCTMHTTASRQNSAVGVVVRPDLQRSGAGGLNKRAAATHRGTPLSACKDNILPISALQNGLLWLFLLSRETP